MFILYYRIIYRGSTVDHYTSKSLQAKYGVTAMTVYLWRKGSTRREAIPHVVQAVGKANRVLFPKEAVHTWARSNGVKTAAVKKATAK